MRALTPRFLLIALGLFMAYTPLAGIAPASAAEAFPSKNVTIINPFSAGGGSDLLCRIIGESLQRTWGKTVTVVSVPGGAGATGMLQAKKAKPDGHTMILSCLGPASITPNRTNVGFNTPKDFVAVANITASPYAIAVKANSGIQTFADLVDRARKTTVTYGTPGAGLGQHVMFADLASKISGADLQHIPFNGAADMLGALLGGHVDAVVGVVNDLLGQVQSGDVRVLATTGEQPSTIFPTPVPTFASLGYKPTLNGTWNGFLVPAKTPETIVLQLQDAIANALKDPEVIERFAKGKFPIVYEDHVALGNKVKSEYELFQKMLSKK